MAIAASMVLSKLLNKPRFDFRDNRWPNLIEEPTKVNDRKIREPATMAVLHKDLFVATSTSLVFNGCIVEIFFVFSVISRRDFLMVVCVGFNYSAFQISQFQRKCCGIIYS